MTNNDTRMPEPMGMLIQQFQEAQQLTDEEMLIKFGFPGRTTLELVRSGQLYPAFNTLPIIAKALEISSLDALKIFFSDLARGTVNHMEQVLVQDTLTENERYAVDCYRAALKKGEVGIRGDTGEAVVVVLPNNPPANGFSKMAARSESAADRGTRPPGIG